MNFSKSLAAKAYASQLANDLRKITLIEFFKSIHAQFYSDQDISFMEYFLELVDHEDEFYVHHSKLVEYGIMTSCSDSSKVKEKLLKTLKLVEGEEFDVADVRDVRSQGGSTTTYHYYLTPMTFDEVLQIVIAVNDITQTSPLVSDEE